MRALWAVLLLVGSLAFGQVRPVSSTSSRKPASPRVNGQALQKPHTNSAKVNPDTPVIVIEGLCEQQPQAASARAAKSRNCRTVITRAQFEQIAGAIQANMEPSVKRQLAAFYPRLLLMQREFHRRALENDPDVKKTLAFAKLRAEAEAAAKIMKQDADKVSEQEIANFYKANEALYDVLEIERIYVPFEKRKSGPDDKTDADAAGMKQQAEELRARAAAGEDFSKLQDEAYVRAGITGNRPPVNIGKVAATQLAPTQRSLVSVKAGEVSEVIADPPNGYYIYKLLSKSTKPLEQVKGDIRTAVAQQKFAAAMQKIEGAAKTTLNENYFPAVASPSTSGSQAIPIGSGGSVSRLATTPLTRPAHIDPETKR
jgi:hypothetical protein